MAGVRASLGNPENPDFPAHRNARSVTLTCRFERPCSVVVYSLSRLPETSDIRHLGGVLKRFRRFRCCHSCTLFRAITSVVFEAANDANQAEQAPSPRRHQTSSIRAKPHQNQAESRVVNGSTLQCRSQAMEQTNEEEARSRTGVQMPLLRGSPA